MYEREERLKTLNRLAARRCRENEKSRIEQLKKTADKITEDNERLIREIETLQREIGDLTYVLKHHSCVRSKACGKQELSSLRLQYASKNVFIYITICR